MFETYLTLPPQNWQKFPCHPFWHTQLPFWHTPLFIQFTSKQFVVLTSIEKFIKIMSTEHSNGENQKHFRRNFNLNRNTNISKNSIFLHFFIHHIFLLYCQLEDPKFNCEILFKISLRCVFFFFFEWMSKILDTELKFEQLLW